MSNINKHLTIDDLDRDSTPPDAVPLVIRPEARRPEDWRAILARGGVGVVAGGLGWWLFGHDVRDWLAYGAGAPLATLVPYGAALLGSLYAAKRILTDKIGGVEFRSWRNDVTGREIVAPLGRATEAYAARQFPHVSSYSPSYNHSAHTVDGEVVDAPALPAPVNVGPLPADQWLAWLDKQPHAIFAAKTGGGKSTIAKYGLLPRINGGEWVFIIDPHSNGWFDLPGVGGGEHWARVEAAMMAVYAEYKRRLEYRDEYKRDTGDELAHDYFPRLTVVFDEANNAKEAFSRIYSGHRRRLDPWPLFAQCLGSGARKVGISVWLLVQSALVEDLGLSGAMRQNFTRIAMDLETIRQMTREETNKERREAIAAALVGASYPATAMMDSEVYLLDRAGLDRPPTPRNSRAAAWDGWDYANNVALVEDADTMPALPQRSATLRTTVATSIKAPETAPAPVALRSATPVATFNDAQRDQLVRILRSRRKANGAPVFSQDRIRAELERAGLSIAQGRLVELCQEVDMQATDR